MKCTKITPPKPFEPIKIEIVFETEAELAYVHGKVDGWTGYGTTYPLYHLLCDLINENK